MTEDQSPTSVVSAEVSTVKQTIDITTNYTHPEDVSLPLRSFGIFARHSSHLAPSKIPSNRRLENLPDEILLEIISHAAPLDQISLGLTGPTFHRLTPPTVYRAVAAGFLSNVPIHGVHLSNLAKAWSVARKGISWSEPFAAWRTNYCWAEEQGCNGYALYIHTVPPYIDDSFRERMEVIRKETRDGARLFTEFEENACKSSTGLEPIKNGAEGTD